MLTKTEAWKLLAELRDAVNQFDRWTPTAEQMVHWSGGPVKPIGEALKQVIIKTCTPFQYDSKGYVAEIERGAWQVALAVDRFLAEFGAWAQSMEIAPDAVPPGGTQEMWDACRAIFAVLDTRRPPAPAPAHVLLAQGNLPATIARKYGWFTEDGRPDTDRVNRELAAAPEDREYNPETWIHPRNKQFDTEIEIAFYERKERMWRQLEADRPKRAERKPSNKTYEQLLEMRNITLKNIATIKQVSEEEAMAEITALGFVPCPEGFRRANIGYVRKGDEEPEWLSRHDPHDECGDDVDARIRACYDDGLTRPKSIADLLSGARKLPVTAQQVARVIKEHKKTLEPVA